MNDKFSASAPTSPLTPPRLVPVLYCKPHQCVGRYKWTVLITDKGVQRIAGLPPPPYVPVVTDRVTRDVAALLCASVKVCMGGVPVWEALCKRA